MLEPTQRVENYSESRFYLLKAIQPAGHALRRVLDKNVIQYTLDVWWQVGYIVWLGIR